MEDLDDHLYDSRTVQLNDYSHMFTDPESRRRFEAIDLCIIDGDACAECWDFKYYKVQTLIRILMEDGHK